jgi:hypothetical protein
MANSGSTLDLSQAASTDQIGRPRLFSCDVTIAWSIGIKN